LKIGPDREDAIRAELKRAGRPSMPWRKRFLNSVWFGRSVRTQILLVFILINLVAATIAGGVVIYQAGAATRIEIAGSMKLAELTVSEAVQLIQQGVPAEQFLKTLPAQLRLVRHVRIFVRDAAGAAISDSAADRPGARREGDRPPAPVWFARLIGPPIERHDVPMTVDGATIGTVEIVSEPRDEIAEVWENTIALATVGGATVLAVIGILYIVLGRVLDPLTALAAGLAGLERRDYQVRLARPKVLEFAAIVDRFNALAGTLGEARAENLALNRRIITAQDDERRRTALELHDEVGPSLFGLKANAASIAKAAGALPQAAAGAIADRVRDLTAIIDHLQGVNRAMLNRLRPMALGHVPLPEIIADLVRDRAREYPHIVFAEDVSRLARGYGDTIDLTVFRCIQESLTNAIRHAGAKRIDLRAAELSGAAAAPGDGSGSGGRLEITVRDDGGGIAAGMPQGFGLRGMRERVQALGGAFTIATAPDRGTVVRIVVPLPSRSDGSAEPADYASQSS
jgi:two-component system, NarL family, sensor histidine kinase UhpB